MDQTQGRREQPEQVVYTHRVYWLLNRRCNFDCAYCFRDSRGADSRTEDPVCGKYDPEHIARRFDETGFIWRIYLTGGEPLLYPRFVDLAGALTRRHFIAVSTNLSTANARDLADAVDRAHILWIKANVHVEEREKLKDGLSEFLRRFLYLQERGFDIRLVYVAYPPLFGRMREDLDRFRAEGVRHVTVKVFQGRYAGKRYPRDHTDPERAFLRSLGLDESEEQILASRVSFLGRPCQAGHTGFSMDIAGNVTRCTTIPEKYGNLLEGTFQPGTSIRRCPVRRCGCAYQGMHFTGATGRPIPTGVVARSARLTVAAGEAATRIAGFLSRGGRRDTGR